MRKTRFFAGASIVAAGLLALTACNSGTPGAAPGADGGTVIYTGYNREEIDGELRMLMSLPNIIVKFGRYVPDQEPHMDEVLGVKLASDNQYAVQIS